jgi:hypothetical protein
MSANLEQLEVRLTELKGERSAVEVTMTREDLARNVDEWLAIARTHAAGSSRLVLGGQASGDHLAQCCMRTVSTTRGWPVGSLPGSSVRTSASSPTG